MSENAKAEKAPAGNPTIAEQGNKVGVRPVLSNIEE
jgi:hypothetical protein